MVENNKSFTILVADDSSFSRDRLQEMLEEAGYRAILAIDGLDALEKSDQEKPDCILLDLLMPKMDGFEVLKELKKKEKKIPVIIVSGDIQKTTQVNCKNLGAVDFIQKPIQADLILNAIKAILSS